MPEVQRKLQRGNEYVAQGAFWNAIASYEKALELDPGNALANYKISFAYLQVGQLDKVESHCGQAIASNPEFAEPHNILGIAQLREGRLEAAEGNFRQALKISPGFVHALCNLGGVLVQRGRFSEAETYLRQAVAPEPVCDEALYHLGLARASLGAYEEAEALVQKVIDVNPNHLGALLLLNNFACGNGQFSEAEEFTRRALAIAPNDPAALATVVGLRKMTVDDVNWMETAETVAQGAIGPIAESQLRFAIGKYWDDLGDHERAFVNFRRANELSEKLASNKYDSRARSAFVDSIIRIYDSTRIRQTNNGASDSNRPVFVVGMPRSGTTLVEHVVASHPDAFGAGELNFWGNAYRAHETTILAGTLSDGVRRDLAKDYLQHLTEFNVSALRVVDKMPGNFAHLGLIHSVFPNARIIHTQRNPIDTCLSIYFQKFSATHTYATDLAGLAHYYKEYRRLMAHWRAVLPPGIILELPYEALVNDQEGWSRKILEFVGLEWDERCLEFEKTQRRVGTASKWQVRQKIFRTSLERWRNYEKFIGPLMELEDLEW